MGDVTIVRGQGGLGRTAPGEDYISGLLFYSDAVPSGFSTDNPVIEFTSTADAVNAGIAQQNYSILQLTGVSSTPFSSGEKVTGPSGAAYVAAFSSTAKVLNLINISGTFTNGNAITGVTSGATGTISAISNTTGWPDEIPAQALFVVGGVITPGDSVTVNVQEPSALVTIAQYTIQGSDTYDLIGAALSTSAIQLRTGYTISYQSAGSVCTVTARQGVGNYLNAGNGGLSVLTNAGATEVYTIVNFNDTTHFITVFTGTPPGSGTFVVGDHVSESAGSVTGIVASFNAPANVLTVKSSAAFTGTDSDIITDTSHSSPTLETNVAATQMSVYAAIPSLLIQWNYHVNEFFRLNPTGDVYVGFFPVTGQTWDLSELATMQEFAGGHIRQVGIYFGSNKQFIIDTFHSININDIPAIADSIQTQCSQLSSQHVPLSVIFSVNLYNTAYNEAVDLTLLPDLSIYQDNWASITIGQDGANLGNSIFWAQGYSIGNVGAILGAVSSAAVNEDIGWVQQFNLTNGLELSVPAFGNGNQVNIITEQNLLAQLDNYRYIFLRYYQNYSGTFVNDNHCVITQTSDYAYINDNRTFDKASRLLYAAYLPFLNGPIILNADGTITANTVTYLESLGNNALDAMTRNSEISAYEVNINPTQNVLSTNKLVVGVSLEPDGVARTIEIDLGYVQTIA